MPITVDVAAIEITDVPSAPEQTSASPQKHNGHGHRKAGRCDFCHAPLPLFTRLRTGRGWGFG
jgi:hypothetical protein